MLILLFVDATSSCFSLLSAFLLHTPNNTLQASAFFGFFLLLFAIRAPIFVALRVYRFRLSTRGHSFFPLLFTGTAISSVLLLSSLFFISSLHFPSTILLIEAPIAVILMIASREFLTFIIHDRSSRYKKRTPVFIYGAGDIGLQLALSIQADNNHNYRIVSFLDDDKSKQGLKVCGVTVAPPERITKLKAKHGTDTVLLAIPSLIGWKRAPLVNDLQSKGFTVKSVPGLLEIVSGEKSVEDILEISPDDLLGRTSVPAIPDLLACDITDKVVCVTGAGGSIGSELCRQIACCLPKSLILIEQSEYNLYAIELELGKTFPHLNLAAILSSVCDKKRITQVFRNYSVDTVYHTAAYKHVPIVEQNITEGVRNNTLGTLAVAEAASEIGAAKFVLVSTDKAVRPANIMGATKRAAEEACALVAQKTLRDGGPTLFGIVRFGNVLDSAGSVIPLFRKQLSQGEALTVTHEDVTRYFMTLQEAAQLILQAGSMATQCEVFLLDMGEPIRVLDMAKRMIDLHTHHNSAIPAKIEIVGLRQGEKLYEELFLDKSSATPTCHSKIWVNREPSMLDGRRDLFINDLIAGVDESNQTKLMDTLIDGVEGFLAPPLNLDLASQGKYNRSFAARKVREKSST